MENTPKNFALQLGALITLYTTIGAIIALLFSIINITLPDSTDYYSYESAQSTIRMTIAILIVFFPTYLWLTRTVNVIRRKEHGVYLTLTKWLIYLSLVIGGGILLGDGVALINAFLNGELTTRFVLKVAVLAIVLALSFYYYLQDAKGYWQENEKQSIYYGLVATIVVLLAVVMGVVYNETPSNVREANIDNNQIQMLQNLQWNIDDYYTRNNTLPENLNSLANGVDVDIKNSDRKSVEYNVTGETTYQLCAEFAFSSEEKNINRPIYADFSWSHPAGWFCFERNITTAPNTKTNF